MPPYPAHLGFHLVKKAPSASWPLLGSQGLAWHELVGVAGGEAKGSMEVRDQDPAGNLWSTRQC